MTTTISSCHWKVKSFVPIPSVSNRRIMQAKISTMSRKFSRNGIRIGNSKSLTAQVSLSQLSHIDIYASCTASAPLSLSQIFSLGAERGPVSLSPSTPVFEDQRSLFSVCWRCLCVLCDILLLVGCGRMTDWQKQRNRTGDCGEAVVDGSYAPRRSMGDPWQISEGPRMMDGFSWKAKLDRIKGWLQSNSSVVGQFIIVNRLITDASFVLGHGWQGHSDHAYFWRNPHTRTDLNL